MAKKILIVDDEKDVVELLHFLLQKDGFEVSRAFNGQDALERVGLAPAGGQPERPDLMILDIMMPIIDGYTVQSKMAADERTRAIPIVILTAKGQMRDLFGMAPNVVSYIEKPFDPQLLRQKVKELLGTP
jgi:two-component system alkaline phosphatase synthesis response regulator PhoP